MSDEGELIGSVTIRGSDGEGFNSLVVGVPTGVLLKAGLKLQIDAGEPFDVDYGACLKRGCFGQRDLDAATLEALRAGSSLVVSRLTTQNTWERTSIDLTGLAAALDGPSAFSGKEEEELQRALQRRLYCTAGGLPDGHPCCVDPLSDG